MNNQRTAIFTFVVLILALSVTTVVASDFSFYMWDQEISGTVFGQDTSVPGVSSRVEASIVEDTNKDKGFRFVSTFLGLHTEFGYNTLENSTTLDGSGTFTFGGEEFDLDLADADYDQNVKVYEFFPRLPLFSKDKFGLNLLLGVKYMQFEGTVSGTALGGGSTSHALDDNILLPQIGIRCFIGSLKKGLRVELMAKYLDVEIGGINAKALDAEAIAYVTTPTGIDLFFGWRMMDQNIVDNEGKSTEAGVEIKNSGLLYGGRIRF